MLKLEKIIFYLLIFCLPFQTRLILYQWGSEFNEWTSVFLYFTDLLVISLLVFWGWRFQGQSLRDSSRNEDCLSRTVPAFLLVAFISLVQAGNFWLGFYQWFKLLEFVLLFSYIRYNFSHLFGLIRTAQVFAAGALFQSVIAFGQYINQASLGLWWFRESPLAPDIIGAAKIVVDGTKMIRAYATFPHPNVLAAFLLAALFFLYGLWLKNKIHYSVLTGIFGLLFSALFLTFSRAIIFVFILVSLLYFIFFIRKFRKKIIFLFSLFIILNSLFLILGWPEISSRFLASLTDQSAGLRAFYNEAALLIIKDHPFLGLGQGNFVWEIRQMLSLLAPWLHQPVHNIYLLIASEVGLIGLALFLLFIFSILRESRPLRSPLFFILLSFLFVGLFDHFFWTLQQGQLLFWILLGIPASFKVRPL